MEKDFLHDYTNLVLQYKIHDGEKEVTRSFTLSRVNNSLTAEELFEVASKLIALTNHQLSGAYRVVREAIE